MCVHECYCISVSAPLLPIHGNVAQSIGECFWGMPLAWTNTTTPSNWRRWIGWWNRRSSWVTYWPTTQALPLPLLATCCSNTCFDAKWIIIFTNCINVIPLPLAPYHMLSNCIWRTKALLAHKCVSACVGKLLWKSFCEKKTKTGKMARKLKTKLKLCQIGI